MSSECFQKNLELFARQNPEAALKIEKITPTELSLTPTWAGEVNLYNQTHHFFYHSKQNAAWDAKKWFQGLPLEGIQILIVIGIGLGYAYQPLEEWLKHDPARLLVFIEDDLSVLKLFLEREEATTILTHPQVIVKYFDTPTEEGWGIFRKEFAWMFSAFATAPTYVCALNAYAEYRTQFVDRIRNQIEMNLAEKAEYFGYFRKESQQEVFANFYLNLPYLFQAGLAQRLYGQFQNVPAIICGAGPSLAQQYELLKGMQEKALIFGAGSALNALTAHGINPHFAAGVDPTEIQENRIRTNLAFDVPFFFRMRFNAGAFQEVNGAKLYVNSGDDPFSTDWFEKELQIEAPQQINASRSTTHFCLKIAEALGCNPIILVGLDLAYTYGKHYSEGVEVHPSSNLKARDQIKDMKQKKWIEVPGINATKVFTTWSFIQEGALFTQFLLDRPDIKLINATAGGMSIWQIPEESLLEVSEKYLKNDLNLSGRIQALTIASRQHSLTSEQILAAMQKWLESLTACDQECVQMMHRLDQQRDKVLFSNEIPSFEPQANLEKELVYREFFKKIDDLFHLLSQRDQYLLDAKASLESSKVRNLKKIEAIYKRFQYLHMHLGIHLQACKQGIESFLSKQNQLLERKSVNPVVPALKDEFKEEVFHAEEHTVVTNMYKEVSYYQNKQLHGPSRFYNLEGQLLSEIGYLHGVKQGECKDFFVSGTPARVLHYKDGLLDGIELNFYENQRLKSQLNYKQGFPEGEAIFYFPNGQIKRKLSFKHGKMEGLEQYWDESGKLILESTYIAGKPSKTSRRWHSNGQLARQVDYDKNGDVIGMQEWDDRGMSLLD